MYVCLCNAVREAELREIVNVKKCTSIRGVRQHINIGDKCGACLEQVENKLMSRPPEPEHNPCWKCGRDCFDYRELWEEAGHRCSSCLRASWVVLDFEQRCYKLGEK